MLEKIVLKLLKKLTNREITQFSEFDITKDFQTWLPKIDTLHFTALKPSLTTWQSITEALDIYLQKYSIQGGLIIDYAGIKTNSKKAYILAFIQIMTLHVVFNSKNFDLMCKDLFDEEIELLDNSLRCTKDRLKDEITVKFQEIIFSNRDYISKLAGKIDFLEKSEVLLRKEGKRLRGLVDRERETVLKKEGIIRTQREFISEVEVLKNLDILDVEDRVTGEREVQKKLVLEKKKFAKMEYDYFCLNSDFCKLNNSFMELKEGVKLLNKKLQRSENNTTEYREAYNKIKNSNEKLFELQNELKKKSNLSKQLTLLKNSYESLNKNNKEKENEIKILKKEIELCKKSFSKLESKDNIIINKMNEIKKENLVLKDYNKNLMNRLYLYEKTVMKINKTNIRNFRESWISTEIIKDLKTFDYKIQFKEKDEENEMLKSQVIDLISKKNKDSEIINLLDKIEEKSNKIKDLENIIYDLKKEIEKINSDKQQKDFEKLQTKFEEKNLEVIKIRKNLREFEDGNKQLIEQVCLKDSQLKDFTLQIEDLQKKLCS